jgi:hypothetical protein
MSPEQVTGGKLDCRSDLFSMGSILHELTTLTVPFVGDNLLAIMHAILNADIEDARKRVRERLPQLEPILVKCMARNPDDRFQSAREFEKALKAVERELPPGPTLPEWVEDFAATLPAATATGEFGPDGAPISPHGKPAEGTQSLAAVEIRDRIPSQSPERSGPHVVGGDGDFVDAFGATLSVESHPSVADDPDPDASLNTNETAFFDTNAGAPNDAGALNVGKTRAVPVTKARRRKKAPKRSRRLLPAAALFGLFVLAVGAFAVVLLLDGAPPSEADPVVEASPATAPVVDPSPASDGLTSLALDEPIDEPTPEEVVTPKPRAVAVQTSIRKPDPPRTRPAPAATPAPVVEQTPAPAAEVGTGTISLNSKPWSTIILDGRVLGSTPVQGHSLPAGKHTVVFDCSACSPPAKSTVVVDVKPGQLTKKIVRF